VYLVAIATEAADVKGMIPLFTDLHALIARKDREEDPWQTAREEFQLLRQTSPTVKGDQSDKVSEFVRQAWPNAVFENGKAKPGFLKALRSVLGISEQLG